MHPAGSPLYLETGPQVSRHKECFAKSGSPRESVKGAPAETGVENALQMASINNWENLESMLRSHWEKLETTLLTASQTNLDKTLQSHWEKLETTLHTTSQSNRRQLLAVQKGGRWTNRTSPWSPHTGDLRNQRPTRADDRPTATAAGVEGGHSAPGQHESRG